MPVENKTEKIVLRVRPSFKHRAEVIADALGLRVTALLEKAMESYEATPKVREVLRREEVQAALRETPKPAEE